MSHAFGLSDVGRVRKGNEDTFAYDEDLRLFVVADGMGGHNAGEVASRLAVDAIVGCIKRTSGETEWSWPYGVDPNLSFDANRLRTAIYLANRRVFRAAEDHDDYTGMGTTVVGLLLTANSFIVGSVGDSRVYMLEEGKLRRLTKDDTWAATVLADELANNPEALAKHPMRNVLTNVLGAREQTSIHLSEEPIRGGELMLLCSDGLHGSVTDPEIEKLMNAAGDDLEGTARKLIDTALDQGSRDNVTALLIRCPKPPADTEKTSIIPPGPVDVTQSGPTAIIPPPKAQS